MKNYVVLLALILAIAIGAARLIGSQTINQLGKVFSSQTWKPDGGEINGKGGN